MPNNFLSLYQLPKPETINDNDSILIVRNNNLYKMQYSTFVDQIIAPTLHHSTITFINNSNSQVSATCVYLQVVNELTYAIAATQESLSIGPNSTYTLSGPVLTQLNNGTRLSFTLPSCNGYIDTITNVTSNNGVFTFLNADLPVTVTFEDNSELA